MGLQLGVRKGVSENCLNRGSALLVHRWRSGNRDHCYLVETDTSNFIENRNCALCNEEMYPISQIENLAGQIGLTTGLCTKCGFIRRMRNKSDSWYSNHFKKKWLECRSVVDPATVAADDVPFRRLREYWDTPGRVLDIGCGPGASLLPFRDHGFEVHGFDPSANRSEAARSLLGPTIFTGTAESYFSQPSLPAFDLIFSYSVLDFIEDPFSVMRAALSCLAPGGAFYCKVGSYFDRRIFLGTHLGVHRSTLSHLCLRSFASQQGCKIEFIADRPIEVVIRKCNSHTGLAPSCTTCSDEEPEVRLDTVAKYMRSELQFEKLLRRRKVTLTSKPFRRQVTLSPLWIDAESWWLNPDKPIEDIFPLRFVHETQGVPLLLK